mmetsp:Transcript_50588/g.69307  ORF Transcript_50588/g.69307 Transcript_50588/m.69307 type:complete len:245 (-) Transcript_50588:285-1019(-)
MRFHSRPCCSEEETGAVALHHTLVLPHHASDVVTAAQLVAEAVALDVQQHATDVTQHLGSQELHLRVRLIGVHEGRGVHLHPLQVHALGANGHAHLQAIARAVVTIRSRQVQQVWPALAQQGVCGKVRTEAVGANHHRAILLEGLAIFGDALDAADVAVLVRQQLLHRGLHHDARALRRVLRNLLQPLHETVGDGHAGEALLATVRAGVEVTTQARDEAEVNAEGIHDPVHSGCALLAQHTDEV